MSIRLRVEPHPSDIRVRIVGHPRRGLVLVRGADDRIGFRSEWPVRDWRRHFGAVRQDAQAVHEVLTADGLDMTRPGEWARMLNVVRSQLDA